MESPFVGIPENIGVTQQYRPLLGTGEGKSHFPISDVVPFCGDPREPLFVLKQLFAFSLSGSFLSVPV